MPISLRTELPPHPSSRVFGLKERFITMGSCFSDEIGIRMSEAKLDCMINPFGTIFNPVSISQLAILAVDNEVPDSDFMIERDGLYLHHLFHSSFYAASAKALHERLEQVINTTGRALAERDCLILTWGTAVVHEKKGNIVSNCHKMPSREFTRRMLEPNEIIEAFAQLYKKIKEKNPEIRIILTVSPVRHIKDTLPVNSLSKSILRYCTDICAKTYHDVEYYPSFEIMNDDLRDYRFYKEDLIHPSKMAADHIWNHFLETYFHASDRRVLEEWDKLRRSLLHRAFAEGSEGHKRFLQDLREKIIQLSDLLPLNDELTELNEKILKWS